MKFFSTAALLIASSLTLVGAAIVPDTTTVTVPDCKSQRCVVARSILTSAYFSLRGGHFHAYQQHRHRWQAVHRPQLHPEGRNDA